METTKPTPIDAKTIAAIETNLKAWQTSKNADLKHLADYYFSKDATGKEKMIRHYMRNGSLYIIAVFNNDAESIDKYNPFKVIQPVANNTVIPAAPVVTQTVKGKK